MTSSSDPFSQAQIGDLQIEQLPELFQAVRDESSNVARQHELVKRLRAVLDRPIAIGGLEQDSRASYLAQMIEAYYRLFPRCLAEFSQSELQQKSLEKTIERLVQIPWPIIEDEYARFNRSGYNQSLKELVIQFNRPAFLAPEIRTLPPLTEAECFLALIIQSLRQQLGATVLLSDRFAVEYRSLLRSVCAAASDPESCQSSLMGWLWEAMKSFDPLKAFSASGHGRPTFEAWVRTVVNNKLADEKRKLLKREADELLFYEPRAVQIFQERYLRLPRAVKAEVDVQQCLRLIQIVQSEITDPKVRATTSRLRQQISEKLGWSIQHTRDIHQQVRRIMGRYVQSTRSLNVTSVDSNQEWIDNYPDVRSLTNLTGQALDCIVEFLNDHQTPDWVKDWCERRRTQAEIARELFVSQPTISRCLGREFRHWLFRRFFMDHQTPEWIKRWYATHEISSPHQRRQKRREIHPDYAQGLCSAKSIDAEIESMLRDWCDRNSIVYLP